MKRYLFAASVAASAFALSNVAHATDLAVGVMLLNGDTYFSNVANGVEEANPDGSVTVVNYNGDAARESTGMDNLITSQVDAIITSPLDPDSSVNAIRRASEAGITVICYNTCINETDMERYVSAFVLSDQAGLGHATGQYAADYINTHMNGEVTIGILTCDSFEICRQRRTAFFDELDNAGITVNLVADQEAYVVDRSVPIAENILTANTDITALWAANDGGTVGLVRAVETAQRSGEIPVFGTDMTPQLGEMLLDDPHILLTTTGQDGIATGALAIEVARRLNDGEIIGEFIQIVPVANYTVENPEAVQDYLSSND